MSLHDCLLHPQVWMALFGTMATSFLVLVCTEQLRARLHSAILLWQYRHIVEPLIRILLILLFIALAYPVIFGLGDAPTLDTILAGADGRPAALLNSLFVIAILLPLVPVIGRWPGLLLPAQGLTGVALLASWLPQSLTESLHYWPGLWSVIIIAILAAAGYWLAVALGKGLAEILESRCVISHSHTVISNVLLIGFQAPLLVIYGYRIVH